MKLLNTVFLNKSSIYNYIIYIFAYFIATCSLSFHSPEKQLKLFRRVRNLEETSQMTKYRHLKHGWSN